MHYASRPLEGCKLYVTLFPCNECAKLIASKEFQRSFFSDKYKDTENNRISRRILELSNIPTRKLTLNPEIFTRLNNHFLQLNEEK